MPGIQGQNTFLPSCSSPFSDQNELDIIFKKENDCLPGTRESHYSVWRLAPMTPSMSLQNKGEQIVNLFLLNPTLRKG